MAITILNQPGSFTTAMRSIDFNIYSDQTNIDHIEANLKDLGAAKTVATWSHYHNIGTDTTGTFSFDVQELVEDNIAFDLMAPGQIMKILPGTNSLFNWEVKFVEYLNTASGIVAGASSTVTPFDSIQLALQHTESGDISQYDLSSITSKWLTDAPTPKKIRITESEYLYAYDSASTNLSNTITITKTNKDATTGTTNLTLLNLYADIYYAIGIGPVNINAYDADFIDSEVVSYTVILKRSGVQIAETRTFVIDDGCYENPTRLTWLNSRGGFDSFTFNGIQRKSYDVKTDLYQKFLQSGFAIKDRGKQVAFKRIKKEWVVTTRLLDIDTRDFLKSIVASAEVFIEDGNEHIPVIVTTNEFEYKDDSRSVFMAKFKLEMANEIETQRN